MKKFLCVIAALLLPACAATGPLYSEQPVESGKAQLVVYHPAGEFLGSLPINGGPDVKVNGTVVCALPNSAFFITSAPAGATKISSTQTLAIGTSVLDMETQANKRYYVRITWDRTKTMAVMQAGPAGDLLTESASHSGPFDIEAVDEKKAATELANLKMTRC